MVSIQDIHLCLDSLYPMNLGEKYDNSGLLICENVIDPVKGVLTTLDVTLSVLEEALELNCNFIISHHPIFFRPVKTFCSSSEENRILRFCIRNGISLYCAHTTLDNSFNGINSYVAELLNLKNVVPIHSEVVCNNLEISRGIVGDLLSGLTYDLFIKDIKKVFGVSNFRFGDVLNQYSVVKKVAFCSGSGSFLIKDAILSLADVYITADVKYHDFLDNFEKIAIIDVGHYESEVFAKKIYVESIAKHFPKLRIFESGVNTNPVRFHL